MTSCSHVTYTEGINSHPRTRDRHPTTVELAELCERAQQGDRAAADAVACAVWPWTLRTAWKYARIYGVDREELASIGWSKIPEAIRSYTPARGGFLNYFATAAAREMISAARQDLVHRGRFRSTPENSLESAPAPPPPDEFEADRAERLRQIADTIIDMDDLSLAVLAMAAGLLAGGRKCDAKLIARTFSLDEAEVLAAYRRADLAVRDAVQRADKARADSAA